MKSSIFIILCCFAFVSCSNQKPNYLIYGKWISEHSITAELVFFDDNRYSLKTIGENGKIYESSVYSYEIIDDSSAKLFVCCFDEYKLKVNAKIEKDGNLESNAAIQRILKEELQLIYRQFAKIPNIKKL